MKKVLYGTTALATAGLVAAGASDASAAERIKMEVHGYMQQWLVGVDQNFNDVRTAPDGDAGFVVNRNNSVTNLDQKTNAEICFVGQTTLDNGITVGVNVQLEAWRTGVNQDWIDESFLFVESDRFGQMKIGSEDGAASLLTVNAPDGGISVDDAGDVVTLDMFKPVSGVIEGTAVSTEADQDGDSNKIIYITPRFYGFQAGASFTPINSDTGNNPDNQPGAPGTVSSQHSGWSGALNYSNVFSNGFGIRASGGLVGFQQDNALDAESNNAFFQWRGGAQLSYAGFTVGGGYKRTYGNTGSASAVVTPNGTATSLDGGNVTRLSNGSSWSVGGTYETGPYTVGVTFVQGSGRGYNIAGTGDYESSIGTVAGTYVLGPGIRLRGGFFFFDQNAEEVPSVTVEDGRARAAAISAGIQNTSDSSGWGGAIALTASF